MLRKKFRVTRKTKTVECHAEVLKLFTNFGETQIVRRAKRVNDWSSFLNISKIFENTFLLRNIFRISSHWFHVWFCNKKFTLTYRRTWKCKFIKSEVDACCKLRYGYNNLAKLYCTLANIASNVQLSETKKPPRLDQNTFLSMTPPLSWCF